MPEESAARSGELARGVGPEKTDGAFRVTNVRRSRNEFERFAEGQIEPLTREVGIANPPALTFCDVHSDLTAN
jgi:hypothetical protein